MRLSKDSLARMFPCYRAEPEVTQKHPPGGNAGAPVSAVTATGSRRRCACRCTPSACPRLGLPASLLVHWELRVCRTPWGSRQDSRPVGAQSLRGRDGQEARFDGPPALAFPAIPESPKRKAFLSL